MELYKNGRRITEHSEKLLDGFNNITNEDNESGYIYILTSSNHLYFGQTVLSCGC